MTSTESFSIRRMRPDDADAVASLTVQLGYAASSPEIRHRYDLIDDRPDARLFVAERADRAIVGWIHVQVMRMLESDPRAGIWGLVVAEAAQGTGVGRALVEAAEAWAVSLDLRVVAVQSNVARAQARGFYEHLGYKVIKTQNAFRKTLA
jgi:GNAT superfamily N-acetyltransferase